MANKATFLFSFITLGLLALLIAPTHSYYVRTYLGTSTCTGTPTSETITGTFTYKSLKHFFGNYFNFLLFTKDGTKCAPDSADGTSLQVNETGTNTVSSWYSIFHSLSFILTPGFVVFIVGSIVPEEQHAITIFKLGCAKESAVPHHILF